MPLLLGNAPNQVPTNGDLGNLAFQDAANIAGNVNVGGSITATSGVINANTTATALRITQVGTGNALVVEDSANPDATPFVIDASGNVIVGYTTATPNIPVIGGSITPSFEVAGTTGSRSVIAARYSFTTAAGNAQVVLSKSRGAIDAPTVVSANDNMGSVVFNGYDGANYLISASVIAAVDGTPGTNDMPGRLVFSTTPAGASAPIERMRINAAGNLGVGTAAPSASAILDAQSTTKGVRMPNMTTTQKNAIASPAAGLMVFDTTLAKLCVYTGAAWQTITST